MTEPKTPPRRHPCSACGVVGGRHGCPTCDPRPYAEYTGDGRTPYYSESRPDIEGSAAGCSRP